MLRKQAVEKIKENTIFRKLCRWRDIVEKYGTARKVTDENIIWCMHFTSWITKATDTHQEYVILFILLLQNWFHEHAW